MRAALLLALLFVIGGVAAALGYPAVRFAGTPVAGIKGLVLAVAMAAILPAAVLA